MKKKNSILLIGFAVIIGFVFISCPESGPPALSGSVNITGTAHVGQTLTADTSNLGGSGIISFQWMRSGNTVIGTNNNTYIVQTADLGYTITVTVTRSDNAGSVTSEPTAIIDNQNLVETDFLISNLTQTAENITPVTIVPKEGISTGTITIYYNNSTTLPTTAGVYTVTFNIAVSTGCNGAVGLSGGTLTITNTGINFGEPSIRLYLDGSLLEDKGITLLSQSSETFNVSIPSGAYAEIIWYINGSIMVQGATRTSITLRQIPGVYQIMVEATPTGSGSVKNSGTHNIVVQ
ncbi:MAG: hypothetical protein FWD13_07670 [Treponema sp.]|nr:hypothetical protein [Treponema sp.]